MTVDELIDELLVAAINHGDKQVMQGGGGGGVQKVVFEYDAAHREGVIVLYDGSKS